jgi:hypothetical protein
MDFKRQEGIFNPKKIKATIGIVGVGSVGSFTTLALTKMGANVQSVFDSDIIEEHNIPNQFFKLSDIGKHKSVALKTLVKEFSGTDITTNPNVDNKTLFTNDIIISCVDSMEARKKIFAQVKRSKIEWYLDSRMGGKVCTLLTVNMNNANSIMAYEKTLIDDKKTLQIPCTQKTIIFNVLGLASLICNNISKVCNEENVEPVIHFDYENVMVVKK